VIPELDGICETRDGGFVGIFDVGLLVEGVM
jgi:hypothetical protein